MSASISYPRGPRLSFRDFAAADVAAVHEYCSDPEVVRWSTWGPNTPEETAAFVEGASRAHLDSARSAYALAGILDRHVIASLGIWVTDPQDLNGELGYTFNRAHWGKGYATEAVHLLLQFGFVTLGLERIAATCHPDNIGSVRVLEKNAFSLEGRLRSHRVARGHRRDSLVFSILKDEFSAE